MVMRRDGEWVGNHTLVRTPYYVMLLYIDEQNRKKAIFGMSTNDYSTYEPTIITTYTLHIREFPHGS